MFLHFGLHAVVILIVADPWRSCLNRGSNIADDRALTSLAKVLRFLFAELVEPVERRRVQLPVDETVIELDNVRVRDLLHHGYFIDDFAVLPGRDSFAQFDFFQSYLLLAGWREPSSAVDNSIRAGAQDSIDFEVV